MGDAVHFDRFEDFVVAPPLEGLGADMAMLRRICEGDPEVIEMLKDVVTGSHGGDRRSADIKSGNAKLEKSGSNDAGYAIRRLRKDRPDLHAKVLAKEVSPHAAMIEAGFRSKVIAIPVEPEAAARP